MPQGCDQAWLPRQFCGSRGRGSCSTKPHLCPAKGVGFDALVRRAERQQRVHPGAAPISRACSAPGGQGRHARQQKTLSCQPRNPACQAWNSALPPASTQHGKESQLGAAAAAHPPWYGSPPSRILASHPPALCPTRATRPCLHRQSMTKQKPKCQSSASAWVSGRGAVEPGPAAPGVQASQRGIRALQVPLEAAAGQHWQPV